MERVDILYLTGGWVSVFPRGGDDKRSFPVCEEVGIQICSLMGSCRRCVALLSSHFCWGFSSCILLRCLLTGIQSGSWLVLRWEYLLSLLFQSIGLRAIHLISSVGRGSWRLCFNFVVCARGTMQSRVRSLCPSQGYVEMTFVLLYVILPLDPYSYKELSLFGRNT